MKVNQITETTTSGSVASIATPLSTQKRGGNLLTGKVTKKKYPNSLKEYTGEYFRVQVTTTDGEKFTYSVKAENEQDALKKVWHRANKSGHDDFQLKIIHEAKPIAESKMKELAVDMRDMDNGNFKKKYGKSKEQMKFSLGDPTKVLQTNEGTDSRVMYDRESIIYDITSVMHDTAKNFQQHASSKTSSVPAAPDTSKFIATQSNMIDVVRGVPAGPVSKFDVLLRMGSGLPLELRREIKQYFLSRLGDNIGEDLPQTFVTSDGYRMIFDEKYGSNWGGFGYITGSKVDTVNEEKLSEEDKIFAPGKGSKRKTGLHKPGEEKKLSHFKHPFKSSGIHVSDSRGNKVCEAENEDVAKEVCKAINEYVKMDESISSESHISTGVARAAWKGIKDFTQIPEKVSGHAEDLDNYFGIGKMNEAYKNPNTDYFDDIPRNKWKEEVLRRFPDARFLVAPEEQGGTIDAWNNKEHVGDWDGYDSRGTVKKLNISENIQRVGAFTTKDGAVLKLLKVAHDPKQFYLMNPKGEVVQQLRGSEDEVKQKIQQELKMTVHETKRRKK